MAHGSTDRGSSRRNSRGLSSDIESGGAEASQDPRSLPPPPPPPPGQVPWGRPHGARTAPDAARDGRGPWSAPVGGRPVAERDRDGDVLPPPLTQGRSQTWPIGRAADEAAEDEPSLPPPLTVSLRGAGLLGVSASAGWRVLSRNCTPSVAAPQSLRPLALTPVKGEEGARGAESQNGEARRSRSERGHGSLGSAVDLPGPPSLAVGASNPAEERSALASSRPLFGSGMVGASAKGLAPRWGSGVGGGAASFGTGTGRVGRDAPSDAHADDGAEGKGPGRGGGGVGEARDGYGAAGKSKDEVMGELESVDAEMAAEHEALAAVQAEEGRLEALSRELEADRQRLVSDVCDKGAGIGRQGLGIYV